MFQYFRGWKRKLGLMTLAMACVATSLWVRSRSIVDLAGLPIGKHTFLTIWSRDQSITCMVEDEQRVEVTWEWLGWVTTDFRFASDMRWLWRRCGFGMADGMNCDDIPASIRPGTILAVPHWAIVVPLTLLSAWLLLSNPRAKPGPTQIYERTED